jgi:hypothetical protein
MAVRIPVYERHVQLDSGAQTIPRFSADLTLGKGLKETGSALAQVAAHWKAKQESWDKLQMHQNLAMLHQEITRITAEENMKFDPGKDTLGTLHDRINARVGAAVQQFQATAPASTTNEARIYGTTAASEASNAAAFQENQRRNQYGKQQLDMISGQLAASVAKNPDSLPTAVAQMRKAMGDLKAVSGLTDAQVRIMDDGYLNGFAKKAAEGFAAQGRQEVGKIVLQQFVQDRKAEDAARMPAAPDAQQPQPGQPQPGQPPAAAGKRSDVLNQNRIAEIDKNPTVKAAIEKVAAETGTDPNLLKVAASIESSGDPKQKTGSYQGLFQLSKAEFGMHGGGDINNPEDNARAFVGVLNRNKEQLTQALGREPSPQELYLSHNQGVAGTLAHLKNPDQPAWKTMLDTPEGQQKGEAWAKAAVKGNVPADVLRRIYGGDETAVSSRDLTAIEGTQVAGGGIDQAISDARTQAPPPPDQRTVVASADGSVISDTSQPPAYVGGMNVGGQPAPTIAGYKAAATTKLDEAGAHGFQRGGVAVAPWLVDSVREAAKTLPEGYTAKVISTVDARATGTRWHPTGRAIDIQIYDPAGKPVPNVGPPSTPGWSLYENMAAAAKSYAADKHGKEMTWGGHFNSGTPFDRMHFQVGGAEGGGSARNFTPEQIQAGRQAMQTVQQGGTVQVAGPGAPTGQVTPAISRWDQLGITLNNQLDGSTMKAAGINQAMQTSLKGRVAADINSTQLNGKGVQLPKELQDYYKTPSPELTYDLIANKLGTGAAIAWQQNKDYAQKIYNGGAHMEDMPRSGIIERLQSITPDPNSPYFDDQSKVYNAVFKKASKIEFERNSDPAGYADKDPVVQQALQDALKNPGDQSKITALVEARMNRQAHLQIPDALRTPLSNDQAKVLAQPLLDRARPNRDTASAEVANNVIAAVGKAAVGGVPDLAHRALQTVLKQKGITDQQAAATADALVAAQQPPPVPLSTVKPEEIGTFVSPYMQKEGYYDIMGAPYLTGAPPPKDEYADNPPAESAAFKPGGRYIPASHIKQLLDDPTLADIFEQGSPERPGYGPGSAKYFLEGGKNVPTSSSLVTPTPDAAADPLSAPPPLPPQPDPLSMVPPTPEEDQTTPEGAP